MHIDMCTCTGAARSSDAHVHVHARMYHATCKHACWHACLCRGSRSSRKQCCMLHVACCMLHVACCMLHVACCVPVQASSVECPPAREHATRNMRHATCNMQALSVEWADGAAEEHALPAAVADGMPDSPKQRRLSGPRPKLKVSKQQYIFTCQQVC